jgi:hypothetical protein
VTPQDVIFADTVVVTGATATAATDLINKATHGLVAGDRIYLTALTGGAGLLLNTSYYVLAAGLTAGAFKVGLTAGGQPSTSRPTPPCCRTPSIRPSRAISITVGRTTRLST